MKSRDTQYWPYMRWLSVVLIVFWGVLAGECRAQTTLAGRTVVVFTTVNEGRAILETRDGFVERMSPFDRAARMKTDRKVSEEKFLKHAGQSVRGWDAEDRQALKSAIAGLRPRLEALNLPFPAKVCFIKTTGDEEGGAGYTRENAIILPKDQLAMPVSNLRRSVCHELFHVLSRANPKLRERLYAAIGFVKCNEVEFPARLRPRKITNPDAPRNDHYIRLKSEGQERLAVPILFAETETYDTARGGEFFDYLQFGLLAVERGKEPGSVTVRRQEKGPSLLDIRQVTGFFEQVGRNTQYTIHPEEILADNFVLLVMGDSDVPSPDILEEMKAVLTKEAAKPTPSAGAAGSRR
jgi:hypothetical protein